MATLERELFNAATPARYRVVRAFTARLCEPLATEDYV
jgi:hypothetical protein